MNIEHVTLTKEGAPYGVLENGQTVPPTAPHVPSVDQEQQLYLTTPMTNNQQGAAAPPLPPPPQLPLPPLPSPQSPATSPPYPQFPNPQSPNTSLPLPQIQSPQWYGPIDRKWQQAAVVFAGYSQKSLVETYVLALSPLGLFGAHHFYLRRYYWGILYFFTVGLFGCGYIIDWFRVPLLVKRANGQTTVNGAIADKKDLSDAYTLWFPLGLFGFHHYYLGNFCWALLYTCTVGLFGIGWIVDGCRMPSLVRAANEGRMKREEPQLKSWLLATAIGITPLGMLGAHNYYLRRPLWGIIYTLTVGLLGVGWVVDWFRMPILVKRANKEIKGARASNIKTIDDAYVLWMPLGLIGFHHFYLNRPGWGLLYLCTVGVLGIGWLADLFRMPMLVKQANHKNKEELSIIAHEQNCAVLSTSSDAYNTANPPPNQYGSNTGQNNVYAPGSYNNGYMYQQSLYCEKGQSSYPAELAASSTTTAMGACPPQYQEIDHTQPTSMTIIHEAGPPPYEYPTEEAGQLPPEH